MRIDSGKQPGQRIAALLLIAACFGYCSRKRRAEVAHADVELCMLRSLPCGG